MYRKIIGFLEIWKESPHRKPLILQGARQVGKTYSLLEFGRKHYENVNQTMRSSSLPKTSASRI